MNNKQINDHVKGLVDTALTYETDERNKNEIEHWESHAYRILNHGNYRGMDDCDGFALTSAELCTHFGIDPSLVRIVYCDIPGYGGHLVCAVDDPENNETWVHDNNERRVVSWSSLNYKWISYMSYDNLGNWFSI